VRDRATAVPAAYEPPGTAAAALQHTAPKLTWDADDSRRKKVRLLGGVCGCGFCLCCLGALLWWLQHPLARSSHVLPHPPPPPHFLAGSAEEDD